MDLVPQFTNTYDLGDVSLRWLNFWANVANVLTLNTVGNISSGNVLTSGIVSAAGNITGGNVNTGIVSATGNVVGGNFNTTGLISATGNITGGNVSGLTINGATVNITDGNSLDIVIKNIGGTLTNACFTCDCRTCLDPDGNAQRATYSGNTINPSSPYTLIGMGYLQS